MRLLSLTSSFCATFPCCWCGFSLGRERGMGTPRCRPKLCAHSKPAVFLPCGAQGFRPSTAPNIPAAFALCSGMHDFKAFLPLTESFPSACVYPQNRELQIMKELKHTNVVELKDCFYIKGEKVSLREANLPNPLRLRQDVYCVIPCNFLTFKSCSHHTSVHSPTRCT